jgi:hypothetical protein
VVVFDGSVVAKVVTVVGATVVGGCTSSPPQALITAPRAIDATRRDDGGPYLRRPWGSRTVASLRVSAGLEDEIASPAAGAVPIVLLGEATHKGGPAGTPSRSGSCLWTGVTRSATL